jgi:site-specific DNA recombinase
MTIQLKQMIAEAQRREQSYRTRRGQEGVARSGKSAGGRAYGYIPAAASVTGSEEIEPTQAAVVRRIFELYADGTSPRNIAARLNAEGVLSPGASWKRTVRRTDGKWLASAIHGDVKRGTGILNNRRYTGVVSWGRTEWTRSASDSSDRRVKVLESARVERTDERLRIVSDDLWQRVKARQAAQRRDVGLRVVKGLRRHVRPAKHLLSGLLRCSACHATFVLSNGNRYQCATHVNGDACPVSISLPRERAESRVLDCIETDLFNPARLADLEARFRAGAARLPVDHSRRISELESEIRNVGDAIARGLLSDALAARLRSAETERGRLIVAQAKPSAEPRKQSPESAQRRVELMRERLAKGGEIARCVLRELFPRAIWLNPDDSGRFLWAVYAVDDEVLRSALFDDPAYRYSSADVFQPVLEKSCVVAGAGFEPATFGL